MCLCMVDSETWLRKDPLVPYSCNLCKVTNVLFIILLEVYLEDYCELT